MGVQCRVAGVLDVQDLEARRGRRVLFSGLGFQAAPGRLVRVTGPNGAGKTTLLRMLAGLSTPGAGRVHWRGQPLTAARELFHRELAWVGHAASLKDDLTALENLQAIAMLGGDAIGRDEALAALAEAGLGGRERLPARVLSAGQRRRVVLARLALPPAATPRTTPRTLWVLDEPFNALDVAAADWLAGLVRRQLAHGGIVVLTSHQAIPLDGLADPVTVAL
jgi:heme exporter protein A